MNRLFASILVLLLASTAPTARAADVLTDIPRVGAIHIDGRSSDWGARGFRIDALTSDTLSPPATSDFDAQIRLGWDERGLLILLQVTDDQAVEHARASAMFELDSVELFLKPSADSPDLFQVLIGPSVDGQRQDVRTFIHDYRTAPDVRNKATSVSAARTKTDNGYIIEALLPLSNINAASEPDRQVALGITINDADLPTGLDRTRLGWNGTGQTFNAIALRSELSATVQASVLVAHHSFQRFVVQLRATAELSGKAVAVRHGDQVLAQTELTPAPAGERLSIARLSLPITLDRRQPITIDIPTQPPIVAHLPDVELLRREAARSLEVVARPVVFTGMALPPCEFADKGLADTVLGVHTPTVTYYDSLNRATTVADRSGRYGAVFEAVSEDGKLRVRRYLTLFRQPGDSRDTLTLDQLVQQFGVDQNKAQGQQGLMTDALLRDVQSSLATSQHLAVTLAGIHEFPSKTLIRPESIDRSWWHALKKRIEHHEPLRWVDHLPPGYDSDPSRRWPLLIYLHGAGGFITDRLKHDGPMRYASAKPKDVPFVIVQPACTDFRDWSPVELEDLLAEVLNKYRIDQDRIYLTGIGLGATGTWDWAIDNPARFAAIAPVAGVGLPLYASRLTQLPTWIIHSEDDETTDVELARRMESALRRAGGNVKTTYHKSLNHAATGARTYGDPQLYTWLAQQRRKR